MRNALIAALSAVAVSAALAVAVLAAPAKPPAATPPKKPIAKPPASKPATSRPATSRPTATKPPAAKPVGGATAGKTLNKGEYPAFQADQYTLTFEQMDARSKVDLAERGLRDHSVKLDGKLAAPKDEDAVAVTKELTVTAATDDQQNTMLLPKPPPKIGGSTGGSAAKGLQEYLVNSYSPFQHGSADVEVPATKIKKSPFRIEEMDLKATVILAEERQEKVMPAVIMEKLDQVVPGVSLRITTLQLSPTGELTITAKGERDHGGPGGPFVEQAWLLDDSGESIGGGRWTQGDPFGKTETLTIKIGVPKGKAHKSVKFIACTKYTLKPLAFTITDIFQR
jgi:hypothetical protein